MGGAARRRRRRALQVDGRRAGGRRQSAVSGGCTGDRTAHPFQPHSKVCRLGLSAAGDGGRVPGGDAGRCRPSWAGWPGVRQRPAVRPPVVQAGGSQWEPAGGSGPVAEGKRAGRGQRAVGSGPRGQRPVPVPVPVGVNKFAPPKLLGGCGGHRQDSQHAVMAQLWPSYGPVRRRWLRGRRAGYGVLVVAAAS